MPLQNLPWPGLLVILSEIRSKAKMLRSIFPLKSILHFDF